LKPISGFLRKTRQRLKKSKVPPDDQERVLTWMAALLPGLELVSLHDGSQVSRLVEVMADNENLLAIIERQAAELDALKRITLNLTSSLELHTVLSAVVSEAMHLVKDAHEAHIYLYQDNKLIFGAALDEYGTKNKQMSEPRPHGLTNLVATQKKMVIVENMKKDPLFINAPKPWAGSIIGIPLVMGGQIVGVMNLVRSHTGAFSQSEIRLLSLLADQAAIAVHNARQHAQTSDQARSDALTGLPNRRALDERLDTAISRSHLTGSPFSVVMMDLDGFKVINDTFGHETGDEVLRQLAVSLMHSLRSTDFLARYGGDEMTLVLPDTDLSQTAHVLQKLQDKLQTLAIPLPDGQTATLGFSGGIALYPQHADTAPGLLRTADEALYKAKKHARGTFTAARDRTGSPEASPEAGQSKT
jgi:diguanylate cyclase (GGDEF)-like protein